MEKITRFQDIPQFTRSGNYKCNFSLEGLVRFVNQEIEERGLQLNPDFQRGHVWTERQQIDYLEYLLKGGKSGRAIYLNKPDWNYSVKDGDYNEYVCVDGLQRITAIRRFIGNEIKVFGSYFKEYTDNFRGQFIMEVNVNDLKTKKEVLQWYVDMNAGGTPHTTYEIERVKKMIENTDKADDVMDHHIYKVYELRVE